MQILTEFLSGYWKELLVAVGIGAFYFKARSDGSHSEKIKTLKTNVAAQKEIVKAVEKSNENKKKNARIADTIIRNPKSGFDDKLRE